MVSANPKRIPLAGCRLTIRSNEARGARSVVTFSNTSRSCKTPVLQIQGESRWHEIVLGRGVDASARHSGLVKRGEECIEQHRARAPVRESGRPRRQFSIKLSDDA